MKSNELGEYIKRQRTRREMTLGKLSEKIGYSDAYISMVENGKKKKPSYEFLSELAKGLNVDYNYLLYSAGYLSPEEYFKHRITSSQEEMDTLVEEMKRSTDKKDLEMLKARHLIFEKQVQSYDATYKNNMHDLNYILDLKRDLFYKENELSDSDKQDIKTFIEHFVIKKEGD
ncbi:helix-turn-helix domain-containing protein [Sporosarcina jiandibaonis]|uniref:helix-turn-helix domain-containing protein n=1 Tax=Sporosarcina jiandibaonis TaxID=2715535 RepID=UPI001551D1AD|nr:helix-turn-helix transcriptional regulator [Sporosarcina jiandibaonis]